jgi:hypothetical protein
VTETALTPLLGPLRHTDFPGAAEGTHDFEADLSKDELAAIEVTTEVDSERLGLAAALNKSDRRFVLAGSSRLWVVRLLPTAVSGHRNLPERDHEQPYSTSWRST